MIKPLLMAALLLSFPLAQANERIQPDGFKEPLQYLQFNPGLDQREFERANLNVLNVYDPLESWNRRVYHFNYRFDEWAFLPLVRGYRYVTPQLLRTGVSNFFSNLAEVPSLANSLLQLKAQRSMRSGARLLFNTLLGVGGLWDPATLFGLPKQREDFGQTLGFYGVPAGPYLMLPLLGPSNLRDTGGLVADLSVESQLNFLDVPDYSRQHPQVTALQVLDQRATNEFRYGQLNSPFEYGKLRYFYTEARKLQIAD